MPHSLRLISPADAVRLVKPGQRIYVGSNAGNPSTLLAALMERAPEITGAEFVHGLTFGPAPHLDPAHAGRFRTKAFFVGSNVRPAIAKPTWLSWELPAVRPSDNSFLAATP